MRGNGGNGFFRDFLFGRERKEEIERVNVASQE